MRGDEGTDVKPAPRHNIAIRNEFFVVFSFIFDTTRSSLFE